MSFELQQKIRQNAMEMRQYVSDLYEWEQQMQIKEKMKSKLKKQEKEKNDEIARAAQEKEIRQNKLKAEQQKQNKEQKAAERRADLVRDTNTIKDYYNSWDKYNVDKQLEILQEEQLRQYRPYNPYEDSKNNLRAKPKTKINVKGKRNIISDPTDLKDKGNLHFQSLEYDKAISCYTQCLKKLDDENVPFQNLSQERKKLRCVVLSNRAMSFMKNQETVKALEDATESLRYNPKYSKSYYRRAECLKKLGRYKQSLKDFRMVKQLEPTENKPDVEIKKIEAFLSKRAKQTRDSMVLQYNQSLMMGSRRIQIEQMPQLAAAAGERKQSEAVNYLDEL